MAAPDLFTRRWQIIPLVALSAWPPWQFASRVQSSMARLSAVDTYATRKSCAINAANRERRFCLEIAMLLASFTLELL